MVPRQLLPCGRYSLTACGACVRALCPMPSSSPAIQQARLGLHRSAKAHPDFPIIGTVPAIKPAAQETKTGRIGVMATESTVKDIYLQNLIAEHASDIEVIKLPAQALVAFVEKKYLFSTPEEREGEIKPYIDFLLEKK